MTAQTAGRGATPTLPGELGRGVLGRFTLAAHRGVTITAAVLLAAAPTVVGVVLLPRTSWAVGGAVLLAAPALAAWGAALAAWRREAGVDHPQPWRSFWIGYRRDAIDVLRAVAPALLLLAVIAVVVTHRDAAGVGAGYAWGLLALGAVLTLLVVRVVTLASSFAFRPSDLWRLAVITLFRRPAATAALIAVVVCAAGALWWVHEAVLLLGAGVLARAVLHYEAPVLRLVRDGFTQEGQGGAA